MTPAAAERGSVLTIGVSVTSRARVDDAGDSRVTTVPQVGRCRTWQVTVRIDVVRNLERRGLAGGDEHQLRLLDDRPALAQLLEPGNRHSRHFSTATSTRNGGG